MTRSVARLFASALFVWLQLAFISPSWADRPKARCDAEQVGRRVRVQVRLDDFLDRDLVRLVRMGLEGRIKIDATLMRSRRLWFDDTLASRSVTRSLTYIRGRGFALDGRKRVANPAAIDLPTLSLGQRRLSGGGLYVEIRVELRVVTASSLRKTAGWITRKNGGSRSDIVKDRVIKLVVADLTRSAGASCKAARR